MAGKLRKILYLVFTAVLLFVCAGKASTVLAGEELTGGGYAVTKRVKGAGYSSVIYNEDNGLLTSDVNSILCDSDGYIWIGGYSGVTRYDGSSFEMLDTSGGLTSGMCLFEDSSKRLWVGTNDNGLVMLDGNESTHITYSDGLPSSSIRTLTEDNDHNIWVGTTAGVCFIDEAMLVTTLDDERIRDKWITRLDADPSGRIYGVTKNGEIFLIEDGKVSACYRSMELKIETPVNILADPDNEEMVYICTGSSNVYYGRFGDTSETLKKTDASPLDTVQWISLSCGRVWLSSATVLGYLDEDQGFHTVDDIPMNSAIEMHTGDYQGNIWVASSTQGVMKIVTNNFCDLTKQSDLPDDVVNSTCLTDSKLYIGTDNGLQILGKEGRQIENDLTEYLSGARIRCICEDSSNNLWISTFSNKLGLVCYTGDGKIKSYTITLGLPSREVRCTTEGKNGEILIGTTAGLARMAGNRVVKTYGAKEGLKNSVILTIAQGDGGEIYAGTDGGGIYEIEGFNVKAIVRDDGLTSDVIMRIKKDAERGVYWIITSNSLEYMKDGKITNVTSFPYKNNYDLYFDDNGNIWVLSSFGICCVPADELLSDEVEDYRLYSRANGLTGIPTSYSYSALDDSGDLYISTRTGVSRVNINELFRDTPDIRIQLKSITFDDQAVLPDSQGVYTIPAGWGRIQINPAVLDYSLTNPVVRVFLEGSSDRGMTAEKNRLSPLEYTGLDYGSYTLHAQILDNSTKEVLSDAAYKVIKKPMFFERLSVRILCFILVTLLAGFIVWRFLRGTVIRRQYEEIRKAKEEAEQANRAKSRFLANMSHEIRTPINTIMGMDEMILREDAENVPEGYFKSVVSYARDIKGASESLLGLINDLLDISKIESGKMHLVEQEYDTAELLRSVISMIRIRSDEKGLSFDTGIDRRLPSRLYGDAGKIKQIILNLLTNAVKYTEKGGFKLSVTAQGRQGDFCGLKISVKDTGIGVKSEDMEKLFTAYERLDEEKNSGIQGTGLGLDISRRFAELMNGSLVCESEYGKGSEFILTVLQKVVDDTPLGDFKEHEETVNRGPYIPKYVAPDAKVLVVDDNVMNLNVIKGLLKATKMQVTTASGGKECLERLREESFHVVLLDHMMPGMDGVETVAEIRKTMPHLPVYALTANSTAGEDFYTSKGFNGYLSKPIDSAALEIAILKHLPEEIVKKAEASDVPEDMEELPKELSWLESVDGLLVEDGIKNSGGVAGYINALGIFSETIEENARVIEDAFNENDIKMYTVKVHALKTSARIAGAGSLSYLAADLEQAGKAGDMDFIRENTPKLLEDYRAWSARLEKLNEKKERPAGEELSAGELKDAYDLLKDMIPRMDYESVEMILEQLEGYSLPADDEERMRKLTVLLKSLKWDEMEELIGEV